MNKYIVVLEDEAGGLVSVSVEAEDPGHAADLALEQYEDGYIVIDVEDEG